MKGSMKELLYFSFSDLLVRVEYSKEANSLKYSSHRNISFGERVVIEQFLLSNIALKTEYYNRYPSLFIYLGEDTNLVKDLNLFHLKNTIKNLTGKDQEVKKQVDELIAESMSNYYFEQIGDEILSLRKKIQAAGNRRFVSEIKIKMDELIKAYNVYSKQKITLEEVIPVDLKKYLHSSSSPIEQEDE